MQVRDVAPKTEDPQQPDDEEDDNDGIQQRLDAACHRNIGVDEPQQDADDHEDDTDFNDRHMRKCAASGAIAQLALGFVDLGLRAVFQFVGTRLDLFSGGEFVSQSVAFQLLGLGNRTMFDFVGRVV